MDVLEALKKTFEVREQLGPVSLSAHYVNNMIHTIYSYGYVALLMPRNSRIRRNSNQSKIIASKRLKEQKKQKVKSKISKKKRFQRKKNLIEIRLLTIYLISKNSCFYRSNCKNKLYIFRMKLILGIILNVAVAKFTPTSEWQVWGEDEPLPEGLHYR